MLDIIMIMPFRKLIALFINDFITTCVQYLRLNNVRLCNSTYDALIVCPSLSTPCSFCPSFPVLHFPVLQIQSPLLNSEMTADVNDVLSL